MPYLFKILLCPIVPAVSRVDAYSCEDYMIFIIGGFHYLALELVELSCSICVQNLYVKRSD